VTIGSRSIAGCTTRTGRRRTLSCAAFAHERRRPALERDRPGVRDERRRCGPVRFAPSHGRHLRELRFPAGADASSDLGLNPRFRVMATTTLFRRGGCHGFQVDGTSFSKVIVMRVVEYEH